MTRLQILLFCSLVFFMKMTIMFCGWPYKSKLLISSNISKSCALKITTFVVRHKTLKPIKSGGLAFGHQAISIIYLLYTVLSCSFFAPRMFGLDKYGIRPMVANPGATKPGDDLVMQD